MSIQDARHLVLERYMAALDAGDYEAILSLFDDGARVVSPFLGNMDAVAFFGKLSAASSENNITPMGIFLAADDTPQATAYFQYDWTLKDGTKVTFKVMDLFTFSSGSDKISQMDIIYDTHTIRETTGDKYG